MASLHLPKRLVLTRYVTLSSSSSLFWSTPFRLCLTNKYNWTARTNYIISTPNNMNGDSVEEKPTLRSPAHLFDLFGWKPDPRKTDDENYMDIVFLITRSWRQGQQGHMGALIVRPAPNDSSVVDDSDHENRIYQGILGAATNIPLFGTKECTSDIHAEIVALGQACRSKQSTENCTAYITIPPCKRCFAALVTFGIKRIITRKQSPKLIRDTAARHGIQVENFTWEMNRRHMERINQLVNTDKTDKQLMEIAEQNKIRRQNRKLEKQKKISEWREKEETSHS